MSRDICGTFNSKPKSKHRTVSSNNLSDVVEEIDGWIGILVPFSHSEKPIKFQAGNPQPDWMKRMTERGVRWYNFTVPDGPKEKEKPYKTRTCHKYLTNILLYLKIILHLAS